jgi:hypothetical protein
VRPRSGPAGEPVPRRVQDDDFLGVQSSTTKQVGPNGPEGARARRADDLTGWTIRPEALEIALRQAWEATGTPLLVTENGIATTDDTQRVEYLEGAIASLRRARDVRPDAAAQRPPARRDRALPQPLRTPARGRELGGKSGLSAAVEAGFPPIRPRRPERTAAGWPGSSWIDQSVGKSRITSLVDVTAMTEADYGRSSLSGKEAPCP